jgi:tetratricopeptide (TPR) repeat protein
MRSEEQNTIRLGGKSKLSRGLSFGFIFHISYFVFTSLSAAPSEEAYRFYLKGLLHERFGEPQMALKQYERVIALDPETAFVHEAMAGLAMRLGQMDRALEEAQEVVRLEPNDPKSYIVLGRVRLARAEMAEASEAFDQALKVDPNHNEALLYAAHIRVASRSDEALALYERFLQNNPTSVEVRARIAEIQQRQGDLKAATQSWKKVLEIDPGDFSAHLALAQIYEIRGDTAAAVAEYEACRFLDPDSISVLARLGEMYYRFGDSNLAEQSFRRALERAPDDPTLNFWMALILEERKEWPGALRHMEKAAETSQEPGVLLRMAYYLSQLDQGEKALRILQRLHKRFPDNPDFLFYVAMAYEDLGKPRQAVRWLEQAVRLDPNRVEAYFHLGTNWDALKKFDKAETYLQRTIELDPRHSVALNYLGYSWADRGTHLDKAVELIRRALAEEPDNGAYLDSLGWAYFKMGRMADAEDALAKAVGRIQDPLVWEHYGDVLSAAGKTPEAVRAWQEGLILEPDRPALLERLKGHERYLLPKTEARRLLKRVEGNFRQLHSLAGTMRLQGKEKGRTFHGRGLFFYSRPQLFRLEFWGPFFVPQALLLKNPEGLHWVPPQPSGPWAQQEAWLALLGDFLSGELASRFDDPAVVVENKGSVILYRAAFGEARLDARKKVLTDLHWKGADAAGDLRVRFRDYREVEGLSVPARVECSTPEGEVVLFLETRRMKINSVLDASLFRVPRSTAR